MTELYIIRHAEAEGNVFRRLHGQLNSLLTPRGYQQRDYLEKRFSQISIDACYSSDLTRACLTARAIYVPKGLKLHRLKALRERDVGTWEDVPFGELERLYPQQMYNFNHAMDQWECAGGETFADMTDRFVTALEEIACKHEGETVAVFAHGAVIKGSLMRLFFRDNHAALPISDNTGVSHLFYENGRFTYEYVNDSSHLPDALTTLKQQQKLRDAGRGNEVNLRYIPLHRWQGALDGICLPPSDPNGVCLLGLLGEMPVGIVSFIKAEREVRILGMTLRTDLWGRQYSDQMLGEVFSHARKQGITHLRALPGQYPETVLERYCFDMESRSRSIDANCFDWDDLSW